MNRRDLLALAAMSAAGAIVPPGAAKGAEGAPAKTPDKPLDMESASIAQLGAAVDSGSASAVSLAKGYLDRIKSIDKAGPTLNSIIELNPDAMEIAGRLDEERKAGKTRGRLHGLPILVKDNLDTGDRMMTTAGSTALLGSIAARDSFVVQKLREAGAVLIGKTNLSEWANFRGSRSTSGWSGRGGLTRNPYALDRNASGSSSGSAVAVAAGLCAAAIGTETNGSIVSPAAVCGVVGLKPTVGLVSRAGIIPISSTQDTAGPMTRCVADAAAVLSAIAGTDPRDPATAQASERSAGDYTQFLDPNGLRNSRLGVVKSFFQSEGGLNEPVYRSCLEIMRQAGATLIEIPTIPGMNELGPAPMELMLYEFKAGLNAYLAGLDAKIKVRSLADLIAFNEAHSKTELRWFGQQLLIRAQAKGPLTDLAYIEAQETCRRLSRTDGIDAVMNEHRLDALISPSGGPAGLTDPILGDRGVAGSSGPAAIAGYPNISVPCGEVRGLPLGLSFYGRAWSEPVLLRLAYAFELFTQARKPPTFVPTLT